MKIPFYIVDNVEVFQSIHRGSWFFLLLFFLLSYFLISVGKEKIGKITHMVLRLFYIIMLFSGIGLLIAYNFSAFYSVKGIIALIMIGLMEISCVRAKKGKPNRGAFYSGSVLLLVVILMGFRVISF